MSGSSLDGLDIVLAELDESRGKWSYIIKASHNYAYDTEFAQRLGTAASLPAYEYLLLHSEFGKFCGEKVNEFIDTYQLHHQVQLIASHGHTVFHAPQLGTTSQLGDGATIAATTGINVVSDLRALDVALGGQGAPIVPMGEKLLLSGYNWFLNIGGIANISLNNASDYKAFDVCAANRVLNLLAQQAGKSFDEGGQLAATGTVHTGLLTQLNALPYYQQPAPKSLANQFGTDEVYPLIASFQLPVADALATYIQHIAQQVAYAVNAVKAQVAQDGGTMLVTGGGALNTFLVKQLTNALQPLGITVEVPEEQLVQYKEALIMALLGILRWREENTVLNSVTGARRSSIGGAVWIGQEF
ncbi:anhydro-N-acetylmuramic acid kinase [Filimonas lacunae]|uniref:Anhydro-N-acetylmuramic acid kinase n=2 Tax=Filimonas lacunae TaxID=477680 RepID=A0A173MS56_9BACT|nr:anhydro-N-acetylmuramic acid kinase [Filimonas lacunae]SIT17435.1 anhydro-N-acetylmuramic acid kinase [Filimonas lacunae]